MVALLEKTRMIRLHLQGKSNSEVGRITHVFRNTVLGRVSGGEHMFMFSIDSGYDEFLLEMLMNALLYLPLGVTLAAVVGPRAALVGLAMSMGVEV